MKVIIYLPIDPQKAKEDNLPVSLPVLAEDVDAMLKENKLNQDVILRGLEAQVETGQRVEYYLSYFIYFLYNRARTYMNEGELLKAKELIEKAGSYKKDYRYPLHLGIIERMAENFETSEILLKEAISMNSSYIPSRIELARTLIGENDFEEAIDVCKRAIEIDPSFTLSYIIMGDCYMALGDSRSALSLYEQTLSIDQSLSVVHSRIGVAANALQKFSLAENELRIALSKKVGGWEDEYNLSYSLYRQGKIFDAIAILRSLYDRGIKDEEVITELLILQKIIGLYEEALNTAEEGFDLKIGDEGFILGSIDVFAFNKMIDKATELCNEFSGHDFDVRKHLLSLEDGWDVEKDLLDFTELIDLTRPEVKTKIDEITSGTISGKAVFDLSMLSIVHEVIHLHGVHFYSAESLLTRSAIAFSGSVDTVALFIFLYRIYFYIHELGYTMDDAIESLIFQVTEISWNTGQEIARIFESEESPDLESMVNHLESPIDVVKFVTTSIVTLKDELHLSEFLRSIDTPEIIIKVCEMILY
jgi:tetratricopeptide (TPR) repeat protein